MRTEHIGLRNKVSKKIFGKPFHKLSIGQAMTVNSELLTGGGVYGILKKRRTFGIYKTPKFKDKI